MIMALWPRIQKSGQQPGEVLSRDVTGDWGRVGDKLWVITETDRSFTCVFFQALEAQPFERRFLCVSDPRFDFPFVQSRQLHPT